MSRPLDCPIALDISVQYPVQIGGISLQLSQIAIRIVTGKSRRQDKGRVAEQIVLHIGFVNHPVSGACENPPDQCFIGGCVFQLSNGNLFEVKGNHPRRFPVPRRQCKGEHYFFLRKKRGIVGRPDIVADKHDILCSVCLQILHHAIQLCVAHHNEDNIVTIIRFKLCDDRYAAYALPHMKGLFHM